MVDADYELLNGGSQAARTQLARTNSEAKLGAGRRLA
jgi:hypothetical protein